MNRVTSIGWNMVLQIPTAIARYFVLAAWIVTGFSVGTGFAASQGQAVVEPVFNSSVHIEEYGKKNDISVVLVHGSGEMAGKIWDSLASSLKDSFHVVLFDLPGFGRSEKKNALYSPANYARFVKWVIDSYTKKPVYLVGHSLGGAVSLYTAGTYPELLEKLILVDVAGILQRSAFAKNILEQNFTGEARVGGTNVIEKPLSALKYLVDSTIENVDTLLPDDVDSLLDSETFRNTALNGDPNRISGMAMIQTDFSSILEKVNVPTAIIWGEKDEIAPLRTGYLLACTLQQSSLTVMKGLKHSPMLEDPESFNSILLQAILESSLSNYPCIADREPSTVEPEDLVISDRTGFVVTGNYRTISIRNSRDITIRDSDAQLLEINDSEVSVVNSRLASDKVPLQVNGSIVYLTGVQISGATAVTVDNSSLDIAGSRLTGKNASLSSNITSNIGLSVSHNASLSSTNTSNIIFSVSHVDSPLYQGSVHRVIRLKPGESF